jgi:uncharacterized protein YqeY
MSGERPAGLEARLRGALTEARKSRDATAVSALRSAIAAVDNAGAVAAPRDSPTTFEAASRIAGTAGGPETAEVPRRELSPGDVRALLEAEVEERRTVAETYDDHGQGDRAAILREEAEVIARLLSA